MQKTHKDKPWICESWVEEWFFVEENSSESCGSRDFGGLNDVSSHCKCLVSAPIKENKLAKEFFKQHIEELL